MGGKPSVELSNKFAYEYAALFKMKVGDVRDAYSKFMVDTHGVITQEEIEEEFVLFTGSKHSVFASTMARYVMRMQEYTVNSLLPDQHMANPAHITFRGWMALHLFLRDATDEQRYDMMFWVMNLHAPQAHPPLAHSDVRAHHREGLFAQPATRERIDAHRLHVQQQQQHAPAGDPTVAGADSDSEHEGDDPPPDRKPHAAEYHRVPTAPPPEDGTTVHYNPEHPTVRPEDLSTFLAAAIACLGRRKVPNTRTEFVEGSDEMFTMAQEQAMAITASFFTRAGKDMARYHDLFGAARTAAVAGQGSSMYSRNGGPSHPAPHHPQHAHDLKALWEAYKHDASLNMTLDEFIKTCTRTGMLLDLKEWIGRHLNLKMGATRA